MKLRSLSAILIALAGAAALAACGNPAGSGASLTPSAGTNAVRAEKKGGGSRIGTVYTALAFDGTTFTIEQHHSCGHRGLGGITPYVAPTSGPLALNPSSPPSFAPACVPKKKTTAKIYIFAVKVPPGGGPHWSGVQVAGPANLTDNPWTFPVLSPGLTMVGGAKYDFVVASAE